jgi:hypothetical protein
VQAVTSGENEVIESAQVYEEVFDRLLIGGIKRFALSFSGDTADRPLDLFRVARSDYYVGTF